MEDEMLRVIIGPYVFDELTIPGDGKQINVDRQNPERDGHLNINFRLHELKVWGGPMGDMTLKEWQKEIAQVKAIFAAWGGSERFEKLDLGIYRFPVPEGIV